MRSSFRWQYGVGFFFLVLAATDLAPEPMVSLREAAAETSVPPSAAAGSQPAASDPHAQDRSSIQATMKSFAKAFQSGDAKALCSHWTDEGEYENDAGVTVRGREALEAAFGAFFVNAPDPQVDLQPESLRFLADSAAIAEGTVAVRRGPGQPAKPAHYSALFVRDNGRWRMARLRETAPHEPVSIKSLAWIIGRWKSASGEGAEIQSDYSWDSDKKFIHTRFTIQEAKLGFGGTQVIGFDPATGRIHSWTFEANGGVGEADWQRDGDHWVLDAVGTAPDGRTLRETNLLRRINDDTFTWQSVDRTLDDAPIPDLAPVKVTRIQPAQ